MFNIWKVTCCGKLGRPASGRQDDAQLEGTRNEKQEEQLESLDSIGFRCV